MKTVDVISQGKVNFDKPKREQLRRIYNKAVKDGKEQFVFEGNEYLTQYTGYLLEFLDRKLS